MDYTESLRSFPLLAKIEEADLSALASFLREKEFDAFCHDYPKCGVEMLRLISINLVRNIRKENENLKLVYQALIEEIEKG